MLQLGIIIVVTIKLSAYQLSLFYLYCYNIFKVLLFMLAKSVIQCNIN